MEFLENFWWNLWKNCTIHLIELLEEFFVQLLKKFPKENVQKQKITWRNALKECFKECFIWRKFWKKIYFFEKIFGKSRELSADTHRKMSKKMPSSIFWSNFCKSCCKILWRNSWKKNREIIPEEGLNKSYAIHGRTSLETRRGTSRKISQGFPREIYKWIHERIPGDVRTIIFGRVPGKIFDVRLWNRVPFNAYWRRR